MQASQGHRKSSAGKIREVGDTGQAGERLGVCLKLGADGRQSGGECSSLSPKDPSEHKPAASLLNKAVRTITIWF